MEFDRFHVRTVAEDPDLMGRIQVLIEVVWPAYMLESKYPADIPYRANWFHIYRDFPQYQFALLDPASDEMFAAGNALAMAWDGADEDLPDAGWMWELATALDEHAAGLPPRTMGALSISIQPAMQGKGLSTLMIEIMAEMGRRNGLGRLIAPVRPSLKSRYPTVIMQDYIRWPYADGLPFDPWMRTHARLGARIVHPCERSMEMEGTLDQWRRWSGLVFPVSGDFPVPELLAPLHVDVERAVGTYVEPNVWMVHSLRRGGPA